MANNKIQVKRTTVSGRQPNTTGSYATNSQYIAAGEFALNMADGILFTSNGSTVIPVGANNLNINVTGNATIKAVIANGSIGTANQVLTTNGTGIYWADGDAGGAAANSTGGTGAIQYYNGTTLGSSTNLVFNGTSVSVGNGSVNTVVNSTATIAMFTMMNRQTISDDYTIPTSTGASMIGPIVVSTGKTLTVTSGARLVII